MEFRVEGLNNVIQTLNELGRLDEVVKNKIRPSLAGFVGKIKSEQMSGRPGLNVVTGDLRNSLQFEVIESGDSLEFIVGSDVEYFAAHQYGTDTLPKRLYVEEEWTEFVEGDILTLIEDSAREILQK